MLKIWFIAALIGSCTFCSAQMAYSPGGGSSECLDSLLNISTGYNPVSGKVNDTAGSSDAKWTIAATKNTPVSPVVGSPAIICVPTFYSFAMQDSSSWISFHNYSTGGYPTVSSVSPYSVSLERSFYTCLKDSLIVDMLSYSRDNWVDSVTIDGVLVWTDPRPTGTTLNFTSFSSEKFSLGKIASGKHILRYVIRNESINHSSNFHGLNMYAYIRSATGTASIQRESEACLGQPCTSGIREGSQSGDASFLEQNVPNPSFSETSIRYHIRASYQHAEIVIYDMTGRRLSTYVCEQNAGTLLVRNRDLGMGMFYYMLLVDGRLSAVQKMQLL